ncbi:MAG: hypothetical protein HY075_08760 [Deltaproteobacteria bacterium]|nr:hypothetical protein [Deltaproteobacteria bacterium]
MSGARELFGAATDFAIELGERDASGFGTLQLHAAGHAVGNTDRRMQLLIAANFFARHSAEHLAPWPAELAPLARDPRAALAFLRDLVTGGSEALARHGVPDRLAFDAAFLTRMQSHVLTHSLGPAFDGFFAVLVPLSSQRLQLVHDRDDAVRALAFSAAGYRRAVGELARGFGLEVRKSP